MRITGNQAIQGHTEWHQLRSTKLGASDVAAVMNCSKFCTPYQLYLEKSGRVKRTENSNMSLGKEMESSILNNLEESLGNSVFFMPAVYTSDDYSFLVASLDGIDSTENIIAEIKVCSREIFDKARHGEVEKMYMCQIQTQLLCTKASMAYYHVYCPSTRSYETICVYPDKEFQQEIVEKCEAFMENLRSGIPPAMTDSDIPYENTFYDLEDLYFNAVEKRKAAEKEEEAIKDRLIAMAPANDYKGMRYEITKKSSISYSYKNICELNNIDITPYGVEKESWSIKTVNHPSLKGGA